MAKKKRNRPRKPQAPSVQREKENVQALKVENTTPATPQETAVPVPPEADFLPHNSKDAAQDVTSIAQCEALQPSLSAQPAEKMQPKEEPENLAEQDNKETEEPSEKKQSLLPCEDTYVQEELEELEALDGAPSAIEAEALPEEAAQSLQTADAAQEKQEESLQRQEDACAQEELEELEALDGAPSAIEAEALPEEAAPGQTQAAAAAEKDLEELAALDGVPLVSVQQAAPEETGHQREMPSVQPEEEWEDPPRRRFSVFRFFVCATAVFTFMSALFVVMLFVLSDTGLLHSSAEVVLPNFNGKRAATIRNDPQYAGFQLEFVDVYSDEAEVGVVVDQTPKPPKNVKENSRIVLRVSAGIHTVRVPAIVGMNKEEAKELFKENDLNMMLKPEISENAVPGQVLRTDPVAGELVNAGTTITVYVSKGDQEDVTVSVPNCIGQSSIAKASQLLTDRGLCVGAIHKEASTSPAGTVIGQSPRAGTGLRRGDNVSLTIAEEVAEGVIVAPATDHDHNFVKSAVIEPGARSLGFTVHTCTICGFYYYDNFKDPIGE